MGSQKPRSLPWLESQLNQGQLEGVAWLDQSHRRFCIPWKHGLRQDAQQEDFGIFEAWAEASGAYTPGKDKADLPTWRGISAAIDAPGRMGVRGDCLLPGRQVSQQTVFCPKGLRLVGSEEGDRTLPGQPITLPDPGAFLAHRAVKGYVSHVLSCLGGGLALWGAGQWLCAQRLGPCRTYWAVGEELPRA
uniref:IRF tryptophan pentad repeat domain-containing protein n=1 Tax=Myotis myotis TaxID=51298 RepID=A0A7J8ANJ3_MYOMY|nr:hypothetical protein mMyoMyo1_008123 [Myotis myotis]